MQKEFNEQEYRRKLIERGLSAADATDLAARTTAARRDSVSAGGTFRPAGALFELPATVGDHKEAVPPKPPAPASAAVERSERMAQESAELARTMGLPPAPRTAVNKMAEQISALAQDKRSSAMATKSG
ncbi:hypothetical protein [Xylophilus ampelinus]|uniref:Uncharacterized protein n=1 Tax=Xylophilus ampelinus TaxID=54067 RepID=A0A318SCP6_9BURK|nr:hypothetical protein [Xylophilus ampelinus]MCS4511822.1 hypothetical protein [Xylophilus ampelinus]PYE73372.1 hypothetical protein DFQ15_13723 [Xylophilus ampelinus]